MQTIYTQSKHRSGLASLSTRLMAFGLDVLLLLTLVGIVDYFTFSSNEEVFLLKPERFLFILLAWLYFAGTETCPCQGTLGKYLLNLRVVTPNGERVRFRAATLRFLLRPISALIIFFQFITGYGHSSRRTFHDKLAGTRVVAE